MGYFTIQLARLDPRSIRSRTTDIDLLTFAVLVAGRDQGHGAALLPVWPGHPMTADQFNQAAAVNGHPATATWMSQDWTIGPLWIEDGDQVHVVYTATNTSDSQIPTADQEQVNKWIIKLTDIYLSVLVGQFVSALGLSEVAAYIGGEAGEAVAAFLADPVGILLGYRPPGPCNGTVFAGKRAFTGSSLTAATTTPTTVQRWGKAVPAWYTDLTETLTDAATHDPEVCGAIAETEITIRVTRIDSWSLSMWTGRSLASGLRPMHPAGGSLKTLYGLRL